MGVIGSIIQLGLHLNPRNLPQTSPYPDIQLSKSPLDIWRSSQQSQDNHLDFLRQTAPKVWVPQLNYYLRTLRQRQWYQCCLEIILKHVKSKQFSPQNDQIEERRRLFQEYYRRLCKSYFVNVGQEFYQKMLDSYKDDIKEGLIQLYERSRVKPNIHYIEKALITNYPAIFQNMAFFAEAINQRCVYIDNQLHFMAFVLSKENIQQAHNQHLSNVFFEDNQNLPKQDQAVENITEGRDLYMPMIQTFIDFDNPHAAQLVFKALINGKHQLNHQDLTQYFYVKAYSIFIYQLGQIDLSYKQFSQWKISDIINAFLSDNKVERISLLRACFKVLSNQKPNFYQQSILNYIFSSQCQISLCIAILRNQQIQRSKLIAEKFLEKLYKCGYQVVRQRAMIMSLIDQKLHLSQSQKATLCSTLNIAQLLLTFNVSNKLASISNFLSEAYSPIQAQQQALCLLKTFISKYFICDRNRTIRLPNQSTLVDLNKADSVLRVCMYIKEQLFGDSLTHSQIQQMVFQHMLYFYRFQEVKELLNEKGGYVSKYNITREMVQAIILENMQESLKKERVQKIHNDLSIQLSLLNQESDQKTSITALYELISYLEESEIYLTSSQKDSELNINLLYWLTESYPERLQVFDYSMIYQKICIINGRSIQQEQDYLTNEFLQFKVHLVKCSYNSGRTQYGEDIVQQLVQYQPPWLAEQLVKIARNIKNIPEKFLMLAFQHCIKGKDMEYLIEVWDKKSFSKGRKRDKIKQFSINKLNQYLQTTKKYTVLNDQLIANQEEYRNHVAEMQFTDETLKTNRQYQMFFTLLGTQIDRAFHHALREGLDASKIDIFLTQGMKNKVIQPFYLVVPYYRYFHFAILKQINKHCHKFNEYSKPTKTELLEAYPSLLQNMNPQIKVSYLAKMLQKLNRSTTCILILGKLFLTTYLEPQKWYSFLFEENFRKTFLVDLKEQPMGKSDITAIKKICNLMNIPIMDLCLFNLSGYANSSERLNQKAQNILLKLIVWTQESQQIAKGIVKKLCQKVHSTFMLIHIVSYLSQQSGLQVYKKLISEEHIQLLKSLEAVEIGSEFYGLIPQNFFQLSIGYKPIWPFPEITIQKIMKVASRTNIFVLAKVFYFLYGMNSQVQRQIFSQYLQRNPDQQLAGLKDKLGLVFDEDIQN